jgi:radical SAM protein with 4Fe4S-binding SPASM domain
LVDDFAAQGGERVLLTGGEALLHDGCLEIMAASRESGLHVTLFSNGILVPKRAAEIHAVADQIQISLDGPDAESNDEIRGRNSFKHILRALDSLAELGTPTRIGMTVLPLRWQTWVEHFHVIRDRYAAYPNITFKLSYGVMAYGRGASLDATQVATKREVDSFLSEVNGDMSPQITRYSPGCGYAEQVVVGPDGTIYPCHLLDAPVCNIDDAPLPEIVALLAGLARQVDVDHVEGCRDCEIRYLCGGSCRVLASRATGSRLLTTCTPEKKAQKYRNLVASFGGPRAACR